jgi:hypothetical protein
LEFISTRRGLLKKRDLSFHECVGKSIGQTGLSGCNGVLHRKIFLKEEG